MTYRIIDNDDKRCVEWVNGGRDYINCIGLEKDGELIAVTGYNYFNGKSCHVHFSIKQGAYPTKDYVWFVHYYPFVQLGLDVMIAYMAESNHKILRLAKHLGYEEKARLKAVHEDGDVLIFTMTKENCRFLGYK